MLPKVFLGASPGLHTSTQRLSLPGTRPSELTKGQPCPSWPLSCLRTRITVKARKANVVRAQFEGWPHFPILCARPYSKSSRAWNYHIIHFWVKIHIYIWNSRLKWKHWLGGKSGVVFVVCYLPLGIKFKLIYINRTGTQNKIMSVDRAGWIGSQVCPLLRSQSSDGLKTHFFSSYTYSSCSPSEHQCERRLPTAEQRRAESSKGSHAHPVALLPSALRYSYLPGHER